MVEAKRKSSYCRYVVIDIATKKAMIVGNKYKDFSKMTPNYYFRAFPRFWRKVYEYGRLVNVCGRTCYIVYFTGDKPTAKAYSYVTTVGLKRRVRGHFHSADNGESWVWAWQLRNDRVPEVCEDAE